MNFRSLLNRPQREYGVVAILLVAFGIDLFSVYGAPALVIAAGIGVFPTVLQAVNALLRKKFTIDTFNTFAVGASFVTGEYRSAAFIGLMLTFARYLDWRTESRAQRAIEELMRLKPSTARRETPEGIEDVPADRVCKGDILVVPIGTRIPVDGIVIGGEAYVNEAAVTGESRLVRKLIGNRVVSSTLLDSGGLRMRATEVGADSTIERMASLIREATKNKSKAERVADKFAGIFLPLVALLGLITYFVTRNVQMTAAIFLVSCADDMAVAIPLAVTASLGRAAKRGVIIKGGEWLEVLGSLKMIVLDKTGTLTYGSLAIVQTEIVPGLTKKLFWQAVGSAEKFSEHPIGKLAYAEAIKVAKQIADPISVHVHSGEGIAAETVQGNVVIGTESLVQKLQLTLPKVAHIHAQRGEKTGTVFHVFLDDKYAGTVSVADTPRPEAEESLRQLRLLGIKRLFMFTGDNAETAQKISKELGITDVRAKMTPKEKMDELEVLVASGPIAMVGDGINDAPALARADVGIAMGSGGTAIAAETANVVILSDNLTRLPEMILLGRKTTSVIHWDMAIWVVTNVVGFALVFTGVLGPSLAAFYNFTTDFLPLINSMRLFRHSSSRDIL